MGPDKEMSGSRVAMPASAHSDPRTSGFIFHIERSPWMLDCESVNLLSLSDEAKLHGHSPRKPVGKAPINKSASGH